MSAYSIRPARPRDRAEIRAVEEAAFGQPAEAALVAALVAGGDAVLELVAERGGRLAGHVLFSRLRVERPEGVFAAVALAPLAVVPGMQRQGIGAALVEEAHARLRAAGELLSVVLGEPEYYRRFGYRHEAARGFDCEWQCEALQALAWGEAPATGRLVHARAFSGL